MHARTTRSHRFLWLQSLFPGNFAMVMAQLHSAVRCALLLGTRSTPLDRRRHAHGMVVGDAVDSDVVGGGLEALGAQSARGVQASVVAFGVSAGHVGGSVAAWFGTFIALLPRLLHAVPEIFRPT